MSEETSNVIREWLADYAALSPDELHSYANSMQHNAEVIHAVHSVLEERHKYSTFIDPVCNTLFSFYHSKEIELQKFALVFLPTLIYVYLNAVSHGEKKSCRGVEALLIGLYNLEAIDDKSISLHVSFRLPSLAQASVYHEPMSLAPASLTESALRRLEECNTKLVKWGPLPQIEKILAQNRLVVMTALLFVFNQQISSFEKHCLDQLCKVVSKLVTQGFSKPGKRISYSSSDVPPVLPRIPVSPQFLLEVLHSLYYAIFNGDNLLAVQAVEDIHNRACYQGYAEVMLVTNAIKNSVPPVHSGGSVSENPMGISMAISPAGNTAGVSKSMITNASFRTKKLPDDIPIQVSRGEGDSNALGSIVEEKEEVGGGGGGGSGGGGGEVQGGARRSLPKMAVNFGKKTREKLTKVTAKSKVLNGDLNDPDDQEIDSSFTFGDSELSHKSNNSTSDIDSPRTMQVSSV